MNSLSKLHLISRIITVLLVSSLFTLTIPTGVGLTIFFEDGFESGDFSSWDEVVNYPWHYYNTSTAGPRDGYYHATLTKSNVSNTMGHLGKLLSPTQTSVYARFYWKATAKAVVLSTLLSVYDDEGIHSDNWYVDVGYDGGRGWALSGRDANGTWWRTWNETATINEDHWYCIELFTEKSAVANHTLWVDGEQTLEVMSNESDHSNIEWMLLRGGGGWSFERTLFDSVVFSDTYIGPTAPLDVNPPSYLALGHNNTVAGEPTMFSCLWSDNVGLSGFIFSSNNTGIWVNSTWTGFASAWSNVSVPLNSTVGAVIQYGFYANDTSDNWNQTVAGVLEVTAPLDIDPPLIDSVSHDPIAPDDGEETTVTVNVVDEESGVQEVVLSYTTDGGLGWNNVTMVKVTGDTYEGKIPGQPAATQVQYEIIAYDNAGNAVVNNNSGEYYVYTAIPEFPQVLVFSLLMLVSSIFIVLAKKSRVQQAK